VLLVIDESFDALSRLYIPHGEWCAMWQRALRPTGRRVVDIRVTENPGEVAKYVTKPGAYLSLEGDEWRCDSQTLEALHYGLAGRITRSRSLSPIRKALKFLDDDGEASEDLIDVTRTTVRCGSSTVFLRTVGGAGTMADGRIVSRIFASRMLAKARGWGSRTTRELVMGEAKRRRVALEQAGKAWPQRSAKERPGREVAYRYDPLAGTYRLVEADGKLVENGPLLDMDSEELERQMQAEFERLERGGRRRRRVGKVRRRGA
jgi:hypothetical protein